jgi:hypothetical protein
MRFINILAISLFLFSGLYAENDSLAANGKVPGKPFEVLQAQIDALNSRIIALETDTSTNFNDISQIASSVNQNASRILDNKLTIGEMSTALGSIRDELDGVRIGFNKAFQCAELRILTIDTMHFLMDELASWPIGGYKKLTWQTYAYDDSGELIVTSHSEIVDAKRIDDILDENGRQFWKYCRSDVGQMNLMDLQQLYQNYNQAMSTLSAIMKSQHDTLKAIISNMR